MRPFVYQFLEKPINILEKGSQLIEYSADLNLSVLKGTNHPAIQLPQLGTTTFTKADDEGTDSDINRSAKTAYDQLTTHTFTRNQLESGDSDFNETINRIRALTDTNTLTLVNAETSDSDAHRLFQMLSTQTFTEAKEATDSDK
ncbi:hypothetical protein [Mucilaginibacter sp. OK098]|uniref:hypothetical protein n=1 Tax=Mucilaginibacter sp. OK098 TaxID=1855297 RepID=UPI000913D180|nr:hypothetical protein [Mucilaginibacter sp. OK098]SHM98596.1 hypothetical protein SAMN05216524_104424 [Mucilaginibacter sp. OK098]